LSSITFSIKGAARLDDAGGRLDRRGKLAILNFAVIAVAVIRRCGRAQFVSEHLSHCQPLGNGSCTTCVGTLYHHIHRLSLAEHDEKRTGDLIGRVTSDIESIQDFVTSALLSILSNVLTLVGIVGVMLYLNWRFTLISLSIAPGSFLVVFVFTRGSRRPRATSEERRASWCRW
jgi:subfamily B ATP-binding cassette protein MsbA